MTVQMENEDNGILSRSDRQLPAVPDQRLLNADSYSDFDVAWLEALLRELYRQGTSNTVRLDQPDIWDFWKAVIEPDTDGDSEWDDGHSAEGQQAHLEPRHPSETQTFDSVQDHDPHNPEQNDFRTMRLQDRRRSLKRAIADASKNQSRAQVEEDLFAALAEMLATCDESLLKRALDTLKRTSRDAPDSLMNAVCRLATHPEMSVRRRAVYILGETSDTELALPVLIQALADPRYPVRRNAAVALGKLGDRRAVTPLIPALQDASKRVRREVVRVLGELGDARAVEPLCAALVDGDETVRRAAAEALEELGDERAVNALRTALDDGDVDVRLAVAEALDRLKDRQDAQSITSAHDEYSAATRQAPVTPVVRLVNEQTLESLISGLKKDDPQVRAAVAAQLGRLGNPRAVEPLIDLLGDQHLPVRDAAAKALQDLGELATEPLIAALNTRKGTVQRKAAHVLADTADVQTQETFIAALDYRDGAVKWEALRALRSIDTPQAREAVEEYRVRQQRRARSKGFLARVLLPGFALAAVVAMLVWMVGQQLG